MDVERALHELLETEVNAGWLESQSSDGVRAAAALCATIIGWCRAHHRQRRLLGDAPAGLELAVRDLSVEQLLGFCGA